MVTYAQLEGEAVYRDEVVPIQLAYLIRNLRNHWDLSRDAIGAKGNNLHLRGYHRSRAWILRSRFATNRQYSIAETADNSHGGDSDWICAIDIQVRESVLIGMCARLDAAVRAGKLEKVAEWYGNKDGDKRVDGYNNIRNEIASSDSSHLWHLHISFIRSRANENHDDLFGILTGRDTIPPRPTPPKPPVSDQEWTERMLRNAPTIKRGHQGAWARTAQGLLVARGYRIAVDGDFGDQTREAVKDAQSKYGAERIDGIVGPETWTILFTGADGM